MSAGRACRRTIPGVDEYLAALAKGRRAGLPLWRRAPRPTPGETAGPAASYEETRAHGDTAGTEAT